jgi:methylthioxylose transferase
MSGAAPVRRAEPPMGGVAPARAAGAPERGLPALALAGTAVTITAGLVLHLAAGVTLGTPLPPFIMSWAPQARWPLLVAIAVAASLAGLAPRAVERVGPPALFATFAYGGALALGLAVNASRLGIAGWSHVFRSGPSGSFEARFEYLPSLRYLNGGVARYVGHFAKLLPGLSTHVKGNPPGPLVAMHLLGIDTPGRLTAACVGVGALSAPLAYALGREFGGEQRGRVAAALTVFSPSAVLFGVTSVDYAFAAVGMIGAWLLIDRRPSARAGGCITVAVGSFLSWVLLAIPVWAVLCVLARDGRRAAARTALCTLGAIVALTLALHLAWGYDPLAILRALGPIYAHGIASRRPYWFWLFGSPAAYLAMLGAPVAWLAVRAAAAREPAALALAVVILVSAVAGFTKAETERIWLPFVPLACVGAAAIPVRRLGPLLAFLAGQAIVVEILFKTIW